MDFRGRVYPCSPHLTHLEADPARAILVFAKGEPLGKTGLDWLKVVIILKGRIRFELSLMDVVVGYDSRFIASI